MDKIRLGIITSSVLLGLSTTAATEDIGDIQVYSTTIDDRYDSKKGEPSSVASIGGEKVDESKAENIQRVLQSIPGITTELQGGDSLKIHIRGIENQVFMGEKPGVAVVIDGVPVFERTGRVNIDLDNIESIKVIKGGASYLFGDDALSGAVIITTKKGAKNAGAKFEAETGSYGYQKLLARYGISNDTYNAYIQASQRKKDGYHEDSEYESNYVNGKVQYYLDESSDITAGFEYSKRDKNSHGTVTGETEAKENPESIWAPGNDRVRDYAAMYDVELLKLYATYAKDFETGENLLVSIYQYGDDTNYYSGYADFDGEHNPVTDPSFKPTLNEYEQIQRGIKSELRGSYGKSAYMVGLDLRDNNYKNKESYAVDWAQPRGPMWADFTAGTVTADDDTNENVYAVYGEYKYALSSSWSLTGNLRFDRIELDYHDLLNDTEVEKSFNQYSYRVGVNNRINEDMAFFASFSTGFRAPSIKQLFYGDIDPDGAIESNPNLEPEEALNFDIGIRGKEQMLGHNMFYEIGLFRIDRDDYIMSSSGQYGTAESGTKSQYQNIGGMRSQGLELALNGEATEKLSYNLAYTYMDAEFTQYENYNLLLGNPYRTFTIEHYDLTGNAIPRVPKHHLNIAMKYQVTDSFSVSPEMDAISSYYSDELNWHKISGHAVFNLLVDYETTMAGYDVAFFARVDNLLDKTYYTTARGYRDSDKDGDYDREDLSLTVNEGFTANVGLQIKF